MKYITYYCVLYYYVFLKANYPIESQTANVFHFSVRERAVCIHTTLQFGIFLINRLTDLSRYWGQGYTMKTGFVPQSQT